MKDDQCDGDSNDCAVNALQVNISKVRAAERMDSNEKLQAEFEAQSMKFTKELMKLHKISKEMSAQYEVAMDDAEAAPLQCGQIYCAGGIGSHCCSGEAAGSRYDICCGST